MPDDLAAAVAGGEATVRFGADPLETGSRQAALIDRAAGQGLAEGGGRLREGRPHDAAGDRLLHLRRSSSCSRPCIMVGVGGALILVAKVMLALLAGLGPLFIAALLFDATRRFFERWVAMIATYGLLIVLFARVFTFMLAIFANYMSGVALDGNMNVAYGIGGALILTIVSVAILKELHHLASGSAAGTPHRIHLAGGGRR